MKKAKRGPREPSAGAEELRRRAEAQLTEDYDETPANETPNLSPHEVRTVLHDLRTHQIELEMQNEELRRVQVELEVARDRYTDLFDFAPVGYVTFRAKTGLIVEANLTLADLLGIARKRLIRRRFTELIQPEDQDVFFRQGQELQATGKRQVAVLRMRREGGPPFWAEISCVAESAGARIRAAVSDVTSRVEAEKERRKLEQQLWQAKKLESLGVLAGGVAHDFNNLLHAVLGHAEIVRERLPVSSPLRRSVMAIEEASKRAAELAAKMLAYSGKGKFVLEEVDLSAMSVEVGRLLENSIGRRTAVTYQLAHDLPKIVVDAVQIRQVIMNLFLNAAEAIGVAIGTIRVSTAVRDCDQAFFESAQAAVDLTAGPYVCLTVADTGCGMDETVREKLFEPFFTTKFSGRGLGMAASLGIVRSHSGAIRVDSEPGRGTSIQVLLPAAPDPAGEPAAGSAAPAPAKRGSETVLVVEGDAEVGSVIECLLRELGFDVLTVADGDRAVEVMRSHTADVRLVLLDSKIRDMRPQEALTAMRLVARDIQVVVMTGGGEEEAERQFTGHGVCGFLLKPFGKAGLDRTIRLALR